MKMKTAQHKNHTLDDTIDRLFTLSAQGNKTLSKEQEAFGLGEGEARYGLDKAI